VAVGIGIEYVEGVDETGEMFLLTELCRHYRLLPLDKRCGSR
jgi:hypothetical protein